jgi:hypothetical protein
MHPLFFIAGGVAWLGVLGLAVAWCRAAAKADLEAERAIAARAAGERLEQRSSLRLVSPCDGARVYHFTPRNRGDAA